MRSGEDWREETYALAEEAIGYSFRNRKLLLTCFTHASYANACGGEDNERLEFLGDAVLQLIVTEALYAGSRFDEGRLTELRKHYVSRTALEGAERKAGLMRFLRYSGGSGNVNGKTSSNLFEAVTAGIYLDGGKECAAAFLRRFLAEADEGNYKTLLQELVQGVQRTTPEYETQEREGKFYCRVQALGETGEGEGPNKKAAETAAAKALYTILSKRTTR